MALYLIDYENTGVRGILGIEKLKSYDRLIIFYGPKTGSVPFEDMVKITSSPAAVEFIKTTKTAKNYLDFQLVSYLGYLIAGKADEKYYIVTRDSGFDAVVDLWAERGMKIFRINDLTGDTTPEEKPVRGRGRTARSKAGSNTGSNKTGTKANTNTNTNAAANPGGGNNSNAAVNTGAAPDAGSVSDPGNDAVANTAAGEDFGKGAESGSNTASKAGRRGRLRSAKQTAGSNGSNNVNNNGNNNGSTNTGNKRNGNKGSNGGIKKSPRDNKKTDNKEISSETGRQATIPESVKKKIRTALKEEGLTPGAYRKLYACMLESPDKSSLNTSMVHAFGQDTANKYYKLILTAFTAFISKA